MEAKEEANLQSKAVVIILHHLCGCMGEKGVAKTDMINYSEFCRKKKEKYQRKCPEKGCQSLIHSSNGKTCRKHCKVRNIVLFVPRGSVNARVGCANHVLN